MRNTKRLAAGTAAAPAQDAEAQLPNSGPRISIQNLSKVNISSSGAVAALSDVNLEVQSDEFVSVLGPSGCGKSTLLMILAGLLEKSFGHVSIEGLEVTKPDPRSGIVFQSPVLLEWRTVLGNVLLQAEARKLDPQLSRQHARELLLSVGLGGFEDRLPHELSGGMSQRVAICRALLHDPSILLMDEPFGALDALTRDQMSLDLLKLCEQREISVVFVTHSIPEAIFLSDRVVIMRRRPGSVARVIEVDLPRPRTLSMRESPEFRDYLRIIQDFFVAEGVLSE